MKLPSPARTLGDMDWLDPILADNLSLMGYNTLSPVQQHSWPLLFHTDMDALVTSPTGSGKTAGFLVPVLAQLLSSPASPTLPTSSPSHSPRALIIAPTREIARQNFKQARLLSFRTPLRVAVAYGGTDMQEQLADLHLGCDVLVATAGRLKSLLLDNYLHLDRTKVVVVDDADRMLELGSEATLRKLLSVEPPSPSADSSNLAPASPQQTNSLSPPSSSPTTSTSLRRRLLFFSATFSKKFRQTDLLSPDHIEVCVGGQNMATALVEQDFVLITAQDPANVDDDTTRHDNGKGNTAANGVEGGGTGQPKQSLADLEELRLGALADLVTRFSAQTAHRVLVFVETKEQTSAVATCCRQQKTTCAVLHGGKTQKHREDSLRKFHLGMVTFLVATDVAARGLDLGSVTHVINFTLPTEVSTYIHRIGRAGRAGQKGMATSLVSPFDARLVQDVLPLLDRRQKQQAQAGTEPTRPVPEWLRGIANGCAVDPLERSLLDFLADPTQTVLEFPSSLTALQRNRLHGVANTLQLTHGSKGRGKNRRLVVTKESKAERQSRERAEKAKDKQSKDIPV